jgi:hypothetical protein
MIHVLRLVFALLMSIMVSRGPQAVKMLQKMPQRAADGSGQLSSRRPGTPVSAWPAQKNYETSQKPFYRRAESLIEEGDGYTECVIRPIRAAGGTTASTDASDSAVRREEMYSHD